jgi:hypothetical protein
MTRISVVLTTCFLLICWALPAHATTTCSYDFSSGSGNTYLSYCVTVNGNILEIQTPFGQNMLGANGEGYGICDQNVGPTNYTDYGVSDTGNWGTATVLSHSLTSVKIARTTADGHWTLTQTITKVPATSSIKVVMALKNNQGVSDVAYLVRFADAEPPVTPGNGDVWYGGLNSALARTYQNDPNYGLQLSNVGVPQFSYWQGFAQSVNTGPNACAFAFNEGGGQGGTNSWFGGGNTGTPAGSIEVAYVGTVPAGLTKTVTLTYHGL